MKAVFIAAAIALGFSSLVLARPATTLLFQNNLNFTDDVNHASFLLLNQDLTQAKAQSSCSGDYGESLLSTAQAQQSSADLLPLLTYYDAPSVWLSDGVLEVQNGKLVYAKASKKGSKKLPGLCTQSTRTSLSFNPVNQSATTTVSNTKTKNSFLGYRNLKSFRFLGIPYSNTPGRWQYSSLNPTKNKAYNNTAFGPSCFQTGSSAYSENCLYLNVFTNNLPATTGGGKPTKGGKLKPVLFWIHGGAFTGGSGADNTFDGANMVSRGDVVQVTTNYRLSSLGFLAVPNTNITGNYGLADQITALEWVKQNIEYFGGDPNQITIYGQSAGAGSVRALLASPPARSLFSAAIAGSNLGGYDYGTTYSKYYTVAQEYQAAGQAVVNASGCAGNANVVSCLQAVSASALVNQATVARFIIVDGKYIVADQLDVTNPKNTANVPTVWGVMAEDGAPFLPYVTPGETRDQALQSVLPAMYQQAAENNEDLFPIPTQQGNNASFNLFNLTAQVGTDVIFRCIDQATVYAALNNGVFPNAWFYQFERSYQTPGFDPNAPTCDAPKTAERPNGDTRLPYLRCHSGDLYYEFGTLGESHLPYRDDLDLQFTRYIMDHWSSFVRTHDPNPSNTYLSQRQYTQTIDLIKQSGTWSPAGKTKQGSVRLLDVPARQSTYQREQQCQVEGLPVDYYFESTST